MLFCEFDLCLNKATHEFLDKVTYITHNLCLKHFNCLLNQEAAEQIESDRLKKAAEEKIKK